MDVMMKVMMKVIMKVMTKVMMKVEMKVMMNDLSYKLNTLDPLSLWQCFVNAPQRSQRPGWMKNIYHGAGDD